MMRTTKKEKRKRWIGDGGLTLVELLVALVLTAVIGGAVYQGLINQSQNFVLQDQAAEAQQNGRIAMETILRDVRSAGYAMSYVIGDSTFNDQGILTGSVTLPNSTPIVTNNDTSRGTTDALALRRGDSSPLKILRFNPHPQQGTWWQCFIDLDPDITGIPIKQGDIVFLKSAAVGSPSRNEFRSMKVKERGVSDILLGEPPKKWKLHMEDYSGAFMSPNGSMISGGTDPKKDYQNYAGGTATKLLQIGYYIESSGGVNVLMKAVNDTTSQIVARYIEDLQVAYQTTDTSKWYQDGTTTGDPPVANDIRSIRVSILAKGRLKDRNQSYSYPALENGNRHPLSGSDYYPFRAFTSQIRIRNYGLD